MRSSTGLPSRWRRARLGRQAGSERLGASVYELPPGGGSFPLHLHHANEELIVVLAGWLWLRTLGGERELGPGEVVACRTGREGAHRLDNRGHEPARVLIVSTMIGPEVLEYPDSGKVRLLGRAPGSPEAEGDLDLILRAGAELEYFAGEAD